MLKENHSEYLLEIEDLKKWYPVKNGIFSKVNRNIKAVDGVSFKIKKGETFGIVGESGCGKSTLGRTIIRSINPTGGKIYFDGEDITKISKNKLKEVRKKIKFIFQDPYASLNPHMTIKDTIAEAIDIQKSYKTIEERNSKIEKVMELVGLNIDYMKRYPHEFSGGQRQRIGIARAIILEPKLIICDEPVSALDVSIQAKIINLLKKLQKEMEISYIFISHDLSVVKHIADKVAVMYLGKIVEISDKKNLYDNPQHPYTQALFSAIPKINTSEDGRKEIILDGDMPSPANPPSGCRFHTRCSKAKKICSEEEPQLKFIEKGHLCACHFSSRNEY
jgi:oligopeptide/dipeptide ABC transporter ATP-binding protein